MNTVRDRTARSGSTLLELIIVVTLFAILMTACYGILSSSWGMYHSGITHTDLTEIGRRAVARMAAELREAGMIDNFPDPDYPYIFEDGDAEGFFAAHAHDPAEHQAEEGSIADGPTREVVFRIAHDNDGDGFPTDEVTGEIEWSDEEVSYVLVTGEDGVNRLERRVNAGSPVEIAEYVERVTFDDFLSDPDVEVNQVLIQLHLRRTTPEGKVVRAYVAATVTMRNTQGGLNFEDPG